MDLSLTQQRIETEFIPSSTHISIYFFQKKIYILFLHEYILVQLAYVSDVLVFI